MVAIDTSLRTIKDSSLVEDSSTLLICSDSQSAIKALARGPLLQVDVLSSELWKTLMWLVNEIMICRIVFQFVYSHCGVERNETVDKEVAKVLQNVAHLQHTAPISFKAIKTHTKAELKQKWLKGIKPGSERY